MGNKVKIHYSFYIFLFFIIYFNGFYLFLSYFLALFLHEYMHMFMAKRFGILSQSINIYPFGMSLSVNNESIKSSKNIMIYFAGPISNIIIVLLIVSIWWCFPATYFYTREFVFANIILGVFNLIPLYPLDGGNIILQYFSTIKSKQKVLSIMRVFCVIFGVLFLVLFLLSIAYSVNISCLSISIFLLSSIASYKDVINKELLIRVSNNSIKESKIYVIKYDTKYEEVKSCFDTKKFVQFYLLNDDNKVVKIFTQDELQKYYLNRIEKINKEL